MFLLRFLNVEAIIQFLTFIFISIIAIVLVEVSWIFVIVSVIVIYESRANYLRVFLID